MANIDIKSYNQILGDMVRKIVADTPVNDVSVGSVLLTLLEAAASNDYENNTAILNVLELLNIDIIKNNDLDAYASNLGLSRKIATKSSGFVVISDSSITKRSSTLYSIKPAPIAGTDKLYVNNAAEWNAFGGAVYIGRGTTNFEGPITYTSIDNNGTFYTINLASALQKDHLISESVIDGQGTSDKSIPSGTIIKIPANNISPEIEYSTLRASVLAAGEDTSESIPAVAVRAGSASNAGINTISLFKTPLTNFDSATVRNTTAFTSGRDVESDEDFRDRIKSYSNSLARGTRDAILSAIKGISDDTDGKQVQSAVITEPANIGDASIVYIDDGVGFQPSYEGQSVDLLIPYANGSEEFLQLANYPLPRPQIVNAGEPPFSLLEGSQLKVKVDGIEESVLFTSSYFRNMSVASIYEVVIAINSQSTLFKCRLDKDSTRLLLYPVSNIAENIQVVSDESTLDANLQLKFPTNEFSYIKLYRNNELLKEVEKPATVASAPFYTWNISGVGNLVLSVDGTPNQDQSFSTSDFGGATFSSLNLSNWVAVINQKYAGITASETTSGRLIITSNKEGSGSTIEIVGGSYLDKMFGGQEISAVGQNSDYTLNRQNGSIQINTTITTGDSISAGSSDTKGSVISNSAVGGLFDLAIDSNNRPAEMVVVADADRIVIRGLNIALGSTVQVSNQGSGVMRVMSSIGLTFKEIQPGDYLYLTSRGDIAEGGSWLGEASSGLYRVKYKGSHTADGIDTYLEVDNADMFTGGPYTYTVQDTSDVQAFYSDAYPQLWRGTYVPVPATASAQDVVTSLNLNLRNIKASLFKTNYVKITSTTENTGSIAIPVSVGSCAQLFATGQGRQGGTQSHVASVSPDRDAVTFFRRSTPTNTNVWLDRHIYTDIRGSISSEAPSNIDGMGVYSEIITDAATVDFSADCSYDDSINVTSGSNKGQIRSIRSIIDSSNVGTRNDNPRTTMDFVIEDEYQVVKNLEISAEDTMVVIMDDDSTAKTIDVSFSRTGKVNSGSQTATFVPTNLAFSASDADNESSIDFGEISVWGTSSSQRSTNFDDYTIWFKARNWYSQNGACILLRAKEFGPIGDNIKFNIEYPSTQNGSSAVFHTNTAEQTIVTYVFSSGAAKVTDVAPGDLFTITDLGSNIARIQFPPTTTVANINVGDVLSIAEDCGFSAPNVGTFCVIAKSDIDKTLDIYNSSATFTIVGEQGVQQIECVGDSADSLNGKYFTLSSPDGDTVKFWYDNNDAGTIEPDIGTTIRSWEINVATGASAVDVATATAAVIMNDPAFASATNIGGTSNLITVTDTDNGVLTIGANGVGPASAGFIFTSITAGLADTYETVNLVSKFTVFPIEDTDAETIADAINGTQVLEAVTKVSGSFSKATRDIYGTAINEVSYDHNSDPVSNKNKYVTLWDSSNWVSTFKNANPNFELKVELALSGVSSNYQMDTAPNPDGSEGEYFKLVPSNLKNLQHHLTHKALSQLSIVSDIDFASKSRKIQIKSKLLGSNGAIEVVGGRGNIASFKIIGDSSISEINNNKYLEAKIRAFPNTFSPGQHVVLSNDYGVERLNRMISSDTMDVVKIGNNCEYKFNAKNTNFSEFTKISIVDANSVDPVSYPKPGIVWRWTHDDSGSYLSISDLVLGAVATAPGIFDASGVAISPTVTKIHLATSSLGSVSTSLEFTATSSGVPSQGTYLTFRNSTATPSTWAAWFDIDGANIAPTGSSYVSATNKVKISILSSDTPNTIISKLYNELYDSGITALFSLSQSDYATLTDVSPGDIVMASGIPLWSTGNMISQTGSDSIGGFPIVKVSSSNKYIDLANTSGSAMTAASISSGYLNISATPIIEWRLQHSDDAISPTKYKIESLGYNDMFRLSRQVGTPAANFTSCGVAVDDILVIGGTTFNSINSGEFRILGVDEDSIIYQNVSAQEELNEYRLFNDSDIAVSWSINSAIVTGGAGSFENVMVGDWVKKTTDNDEYFVQVLDLLDSADASTTPSLAIKLLLGSNYNGISGSSKSHAINQITDIGTGRSLKSTSDIRILEADSVRLGDSIFIPENVSSSWFNVLNCGKFDIKDFGTRSTSSSTDDMYIYVKVENPSGISQQNINMGTVNSKFTITEGYENRFTSIKQISHIAIDETNSSRRVVYLSPGDRAYKWSQSNATSISALGRIGFSQDITTGIDGYLYYTGLLRKVQRTIDGFEPDPSNFPGRRAVGSLIEILPPLPVRVSVSLEVTTRDGVNLSEISDEITSSIINYVSDLGVGEDVILSDIIVRVKNIDGVAAVTFITPEPSNERIFVGNGEKAFIEPSDISIA